MQAQVDAGGGARAGQDVALVDEDRLAVDAQPREAPAQLVQVQPVRRRAAAVEEARGSQDEAAATHPRDDGATLPSANQRSQQVRRRLVVNSCPRHEYEVGRFQRLEPVLGHEGDPVADDGPWLSRDDHHPMRRHPSGSAVGAEDLTGNGQL